MSLELRIRSVTYNRNAKYAACRNPECRSRIKSDKRIWWGDHGPHWGYCKLECKTRHLELTRSGASERVRKFKEKQHGNQSRDELSKKGKS